MSVLYIRNTDGTFIQVPGIPGKSAYEIAVAYGVFTGTEEEFAQSQVFDNKDVLDAITEDRVIEWDSKATETYVKNAIAQAQLGGVSGDVDLSGFATQDDLKKYVLKEEGKSLIADSELERLSAIESYDDTELRSRVNSNTVTINTMLDKLDTPPTYSNPTLSISLSRTTMVHNTSTNITITPNFNQNDAGAVTSYILKKGTETLVNSASAQSYTDNVNVPHGTSITYTATVSYSDGIIKNTLFGIPYPSTSIKAGSISANNTVRAYANSYYGVINSSTLTEADIPNLTVRFGTSRGCTLTYTMTGQRSVYMYPQSFGALTSIKDANNFDYINSYTRTTMAYNGVDYYVYVLTDPVTIAEFKQIFS